MFFNASYTANAWHGFWGVLLGLMTIVQRDPTGLIQRIFTPFVNSGSFKANGIDFGLQYTYPTSFGTFTSYTNVSWLNSFQFASAPGSAEVELAGYTTDPFVTDDGYVKWKGISRLDWPEWNRCVALCATRAFHERKSNEPFTTNQTWVFDGRPRFTFAPQWRTNWRGLFEGCKKHVHGQTGRQPNRGQPDIN
jgi:hypothetical protein